VAHNSPYPSLSQSYYPLSGIVYLKIQGTEFSRYVGQFSPADNKVDLFQLNPPSGNHCTFPPGTFSLTSLLRTVDVSPRTLTYVPVPSDKYPVHSPRPSSRASNAFFSFRTKMADQRHWDHFFYWFFRQISIFQIRFSFLTFSAFPNPPHPKD